MIDPPERRRSEGRFGGLRQFGGFRGVGTRDWAARVSLRGERGCASEPVAREGGHVRRPGGGRRARSGRLSAALAHGRSGGPIGQNEPVDHDGGCGGITGYDHM